MLSQNQEDVLIHSISSRFGLQHGQKQCRPFESLSPKSRQPAFQSPDLQGNPHRSYSVPRRQFRSVHTYEALFNAHRKLSLLEDAAVRRHTLDIQNEKLTGAVQILVENNARLRGDMVGAMKARQLLYQKSYEIAHQAVSNKAKVPRYFQIKAARVLVLCASRVFKKLLLASGLQRWALATVYSEEQDRKTQVDCVFQLAERKEKLSVSSLSEASVNAAEKVSHQASTAVLKWTPKGGLMSNQEDRTLKKGGEEGYLNDLSYRSGSRSSKSSFSSEDPPKARVLGDRNSSGHSGSSKCNYGRLNPSMQEPNSDVDSAHFQSTHLRFDGSYSSSASESNESIPQRLRSRDQMSKLSHLFPNENLSPIPKNKSANIPLSAGIEGHLQSSHDYQTQSRTKLPADSEVKAGQLKRSGSHPEASSLQRTVTGSSAPNSLLEMQSVTQTPLVGKALKFQGTQKYEQAILQWRCR